MKVFVVSGNQFVGNLNGVFNDSYFNEHLVTVDVSNNGFDGTVPTTLFSSHSLEEFICGNNCFSGDIPSAVCNADSLKTLDMSGLTAGQSCITKYTGLFNFYTAKEVAGSLPACLFSINTLESLSMSGNGIRSKLYDISVDSSLINVSLSYNRLSGTIPLSIQHHVGFRKLDLSYNRLTGTIDQMNYYNSTSIGGTVLYLESNRLSGDIPSSFEPVKSINRLDGNMFQCQSVDQLPQHDPNVNNYICGSQNLDEYLYAVAATIILGGNNNCK